jgi:sugar/nucleoside kinase (ribokinase family)
MSPAGFDILVVGEINPDLILTGDVTPAFGQAEQLVEAAALTIGSSSAIFACGAARLGLRVAFVGLCGADPFGRFMLESLHERAVDVTHVVIDQRLRTGVSVILSRVADRSILTYPGCMTGLDAEQVTEDALLRARHLHVSSYFLQTGLRPGLPSLLRRARSLGLTTSLDTNWDPAEAWLGVLDLLPDSNVFMPNAAEARAISGQADVAQAALDLSTRAGVVAVKLGAEGALGAQSGHLAQVPSIPVQVVDSVGAGDSFDAGFICGYLKGWDLERCLRLAAVCGALSTQAAGGTDAQPTLEEALRLV